MINAEFRRLGKEGYCGFTVSGHSGHAKRGKDIICAAVSGATDLAVCILCDVLKAESELSVDDKNAEVSLSLLAANSDADRVITGLHMYLTDLSKEYPVNIRVREV
jgi:uncharacterized protein YsxB (DUF464 family)